MRFPLNPVRKLFLGQMKYFNDLDGQVWTRYDMRLGIGCRAGVLLKPVLKKLAEHWEQFRRASQ